MERRRRFWLLLPTIPAILSDYVVTLARQPDTYWSGDYSATHEGQVILAFFLRIHPLAFVAFAALWISLTTVLMVFLPQKAAITVACYLTLSHVWGFWTWCVGIPGSGYIMGAVQLAEAALLAVACTKVISPFTPKQP